MTWLVREVAWLPAAGALTDALNDAVDDGWDVFAVLVRDDRFYVVMRRA